MTNLNLPDMGFDNLSRLAGTELKKVAYATFIRRVDDGAVKVMHHSTVIAEISDGFVEIHTAGYNSKTTAHRLNAILQDNRTGYSARYRPVTDGVIVFYGQGYEIENRGYSTFARSVAA